MKRLLRAYEWSELNPMRVHTLLFALRDIIYGITIAWGIPDVKHTALYYDLESWNSVALFGVLLMLAGIASGVSTLYRSGKPGPAGKVTSAALGLSAWLWTFVTASFFVAHNAAAGMMFLCGFTLTTGFLGYRYKWSRNNRVVLNPHGKYQKEQL
jgi:hypothetical protein